MNKLLTDICDIQYGYAFDSALFSTDKGIPIVRIRDVVRGYSETKTTESCPNNYYVENGDILIGMDGEFNISKWNGGKAVLNQRVCKLIPRGINADYLFYYMPKALKAIEDKTPFVTVKHLSSKELNKVVVPVPDIEKQVRIAKVLSLINSLLTRYQIEMGKLDELIKSRFVEMFGDPMTNPMKWIKKPLLQLGSCKNGMNFRSNDSGIEIQCLGVGDFKDFSTIPDTSVLPKISLNEMPSVEYLLRDNDIVFVRSNGNKALVGRCLAVYPGDIPTTFSGFCIRFRIEDNSITVPYLLRVLKTESVRKKVAGRGANIQNLNQKILSSLEIPIPPIDLQNQFADFVSQVDKTKSEVKQSIEKLETLKKSLMQEYFG